MDKLTFFFETDSPNLGKGEGETKNTGDIYIQDFFATYSFMDELKIDGGLMLPPSAYNHLQSAATLMPVDYMPYTFTENTTMQERVGRDYGVQARGYIAKHFEYRAGVFQGSRDQNATRPLRWNARVAYHVFDAQTGYFYTGTSLGTKHYLTFGASYDAQNTYKTYAFDAFWDQPVGPGAFTLQVDYQNFDGGDDFPSLPKQGDTQVEAGFYFKSVKLTPYATWADQSYSEDLDATGKPLADTSKWMLGIAWFPFGHKFNLKLAGGQLSRDFDAVAVTGGGWEKVDAPNRTVFQLQAQIFVF